MSNHTCWSGIEKLEKIEIISRLRGMAEALATKEINQYTTSGREVYKLPHR
jgi:hypothetical protein